VRRLRWRGGASTTLRELVTASAAETEEAGARLAGHLRRGDLLLLEGPLGAGKTTFVRGLHRGLRASGDVASPTFQLLRLYPGPTPLAHADLFRLQSSAELDDLGLDELLDGGVVVVEWGDRLGEAAGARLQIEALGADRRRLSLHGGRTDWSLS
jgi:tRNA threonylcarbamoyladenosine biosynthesis protein TsaE